ncbi:MAG: hypothetical protein JW856_05905 [Dehalococcoidales bacterium]|nr:hypothetical protein [Dehalococcoidales bacterium]
MSRGRNTTVIGIRLPDNVVDELKQMARRKRITVTELLKPEIYKFVARNNAEKSAKVGHSKSEGSKSSGIEGEVRAFFGKEFSKPAAPEPTASAEKPDKDGSQPEE